MPFLILLGCMPQPVKVSSWVERLWHLHCLQGILWFLRLISCVWHLLHIHTWERMVRNLKTLWERSCRLLWLSKQDHPIQVLVGVVSRYMLWGTCGILRCVHYTVVSKWVLLCVPSSVAWIPHPTFCFWILTHCLWVFSWRVQIYNRCGLGKPLPRPLLSWILVVYRM